MADQTRPRGPARSHDQQRNALADAALELVARDGLAALTVRRVATHAAVSPGRVQHYFPTRDALLEAAFDRANQQSTERISARAEASGAEAGADLVAVVLDELIPYGTARDTHLRVRHTFGALGLSDRTTRDRLHTLYEQLVDILTGEASELSRPTAYDLVAHAEGLAYHVLLGTLDAPEARARLRAAVVTATDP